MREKFVGRPALLLAEQSRASGRAALASLRADPTMLHSLAVLLADFAAAFARFDAGAHLRPGDVEIGPGETRNDPCRSEAHIGAIVAVADALHHLGDILFPEAGIGTGIARLRARIAGGDALQGFAVIGGRVDWMRLEHL